MKIPGHFILLIIISIWLSSAAKAGPTVESFHQWLQGSWGQVKEDGSELPLLVAKGCDSLSSDIPNRFIGKLKGRKVIDDAFWGDFAFGSVDGKYVVVSAFSKAPKSVEDWKQISYAEGAEISAKLITNQDGYVVLEMQSQIPGLEYPRVITPVTNDMFRLENGIEDGKPVYGTSRYFKRCK